MRYEAKFYVAMQVFVSRGQLGKTALACVSSCIATDQWGGLVGLLQGAQAALEGQAEPELQSLAQEMRQVSTARHYSALCSASNC